MFRLFIDTETVEKDTIVVESEESLKELLDYLIIVKSNHCSILLQNMDFNTTLRCQKLLETVVSSLSSLSVYLAEPVDRGLVSMADEVFKTYKVRKYDNIDLMLQRLNNQPLNVKLKELFDNMAR